MSCPTLYSQHMYILTHHKQLAACKFVTLCSCSLACCPRVLPPSQHAAAATTATAATTAACQPAYTQTLRATVVFLLCVPSSTSATTHTYTPQRSYNVSALRQNWLGWSRHHTAPTCCFARPCCTRISPCPTCCECSWSRCCSAPSPHTPTWWSASSLLLII